MQSRYEHGGLIWVDLESPSRDEIRAIAEEFQLESLVAEELLLPVTKPRAEFHPAYAYIVMHFPALYHSHKTHEQEIDFIVGKRFIITTRYDTVDPLHKFSKVLEVNSVLAESNIGDHAGFMFFFMLKKLYRSIEHEVEYVKHDLGVIEEHIFSGHEVRMVEAISRSARDLLNLRQTIEPHREILHTLEEEGAAFFGEPFLPYLRALSNEYYRVHNHVMRHTEFLHELRETNNSLLSTKQNETMKRFTILAFTTFPLTLIAAIFSMDTKSTPIVGLSYDWWIIVGGMIIASICMFAYFKRKEWL
ncbi:MAG TPA: CorA family divalent cation transporter [Candidatus Paceibacterota bacterium]|nr:CorA family divalent cation transporter [Candidatus Paceibacterota bacterium]